MLQRYNTRYATCNLNFGLLLKIAPRLRVSEGRVMLASTLPSGRTPAMPPEHLLERKKLDKNFVNSC
ncbi:MAG: hypothetical protein IKW91_05765 [Bacteroidaceae bacterium]|nr:hypothetical protein [Bacteroidaceae bacterium]